MRASRTGSLPIPNLNSTRRGPTHPWPMATTTGSFSPDNISPAGAAQIRSYSVVLPISVRLPAVGSPRLPISHSSAASRQAGRGSTRASGCNIPGTIGSTALASVHRPTTRCSLTCGWRCDQTQSRSGGVAMKATVLGGAAASLLTVSAFAADLGIPAAQPQVVIPPFTWTSCYAGVQAGAGWGKKDLTDTVGILSSLPGGFSAASLDVSGWMVGGQFGCDYQFAPTWVVGIEGAASGGNISKTTTFATTVTEPGDDIASFRSTTDFLASITGRIGYAFDRWMVYGKGGVALVGDRYHSDDVGGNFFFDATENRIGWTAGAGVEWAFTPEWSVKLEYDYYGFGTKSLSFTDTTILGAPASPFIAPANINQNIQVVLLGVNFHARSGPDW